MTCTLSKAIATLIVATLASPAALASQVIVPDDFPLIQQAVDAAAPGDVILIRNVPGVQGNNPVIVDKPLSLVGYPTFQLTSFDCAGPGAGAHGALWLSGPGAGTVRVIGMTNIGFNDCVYPPPAIGGGGFEALHVYDSTLVGTQGGQTGSGYSGQAIDVDVDRLVLTDCTVTGGGMKGYDACSQVLDHAGAAVRVVGGTVVAVGCKITGGSGIQTFCCDCSCPDDMMTLVGQGGAGVEAAELYQAYSIIEGGEGATFVARPQSGPVSVLCGQLPDGPALVVDDQVVLTGELLVLLGDGLMHLGQTTTIMWSYAGSGSQADFVSLYAAPGVAAPLLTQHGQVFLDLAALSFIGSYHSSLATAQLPVPNDPKLIGMDLALQAYSGNQGLSTPVFTAVVP